MSKVKAALTAGLLFFIISSPATYKFVDSLVGGLVGAVAPGLMHYFRIAESGCPTTYGLAVHALVFAAVVYYLMK
jgi:hypothetical protein